MASAFPNRFSACVGKLYRKLGTTEAVAHKLLKGLQVYKLAYKLNVRQQELFACFPQPYAVTGQ
jgi:hypothetical protein